MTCKHCDDTKIDVFGAPCVCTTTKKRHHKPANLASDAQIKFLTSLITERDPKNPTIEAINAILSNAETPLSKKAASKWIDQVRLAPKKPVVPGAAPVAEIRKNMHPGKCHTCDAWIEATEGRIDKVDGKWVVFHIGTCPDPATLPKVEPITEPGMFRNPDTGDILRVKWNMAKTRLYGQRIVVREFDDHRPAEVDFVYDAKGFAALRPEHKLSFSEAAAFGASFSACVNCGKHLEDDRSVVAGYGPTCAHNHGWPMPTAKQAEQVIAGTAKWDGTFQPIERTAP